GWRRNPNANDQESKWRYWLRLWLKWLDASPAGPAVAGRTDCHHASIRSGSSGMVTDSGAAKLSHAGPDNGETGGRMGTPASMAAVKASRSPPPFFSSAPNLLSTTRSQPAATSRRTEAAAASAPAPASWHFFEPGPRSWKIWKRSPLVRLTR